MLRKISIITLMGLLALTGCQTEEVQPATSNLPDAEGRPYLGEFMSAWEAADALNARSQDDVCKASFVRTTSQFEWLYEGPQYNTYDIAYLENKAEQMAWENARSGPGWIETVRSIDYHVDLLLCGCDAYFIGITVTYQVCALPCWDCGPGPVEEV